MKRKAEVTPTLTPAKKLRIADNKTDAFIEWLESQPKGSIEYSELHLGEDPTCLVDYIVQNEIQLNAKNKNNDSLMKLLFIQLGPDFDEFSTELFGEIRNGTMNQEIIFSLDYISHLIQQLLSEYDENLVHELDETFSMINKCIVEIDRECIEKLYQAVKEQLSLPYCQMVYILSEIVFFCNNWNISETEIRRGLNQSALPIRRFFPPAYNKIKEVAKNEYFEMANATLNSVFKNSVSTENYEGFKACLENLKKEYNKYLGPNDIVNTWFDQIIQELTFEGENYSFG